MIAMSEYFRYINKRDKLLKFLGTLSAIIAGVFLPCISLAVGAVTNSFNPQTPKDAMLEQMKTVTLYICLVGIGTWIFGYIYYGFWQHLAQNISFDLRSRYLHAILQQEVGYFEKSNVEQLPSQIGENFAIVTEGIGEKYSNIIFSLASLLSGIGIAFYRGADFAAVCTGFVPFIFIIMVVFVGQVKKSAMAKVIVVKKMCGAVEESLSAIRLIISFANEAKEEKKFLKLAEETCNVAKK